MHSIPETGFLRLAQILGNPRAKPPIPPIIPISKSSWYAGIASGRYPKSVKLSRNTAVWKIEDVLALIASAK